MNKVSSSYIINALFLQIINIAFFENYHINTTFASALRIFDLFLGYLLLTKNNSDEFFNSFENKKKWLPENEALTDA